MEKIRKMIGCLTAVCLLLAVAAFFLPGAVGTALSVLAQLGAGPEDGLYITGNDVTWKQLIGENSLLSLVKTYVCQKVRLIFDPPLTSSVLDAMERSLKEMEWRILAVTDISADSGDVTECVDREARAEIAEHAVLEVNNG